MKIRSYRIPTALLLIFALLLTVCGSALEFPASAQDASANRNLSICLKDDWHVYVDYNDSGEENEWYTGFLGNGKTVSLPYDTAQDAWTSVIWFSNIFKADLGLQEGQRVVIDFEGVQYYAKIWLNGNYIGDHEGGVEGFSFDVTDYIRDGEDNLLALRLYTPRGEDTYEGGHDGELGWGLFGGTQRIQTPVYVRVVPEVYITDTYVNTNYADGTVDVELTVNNASYASRRVRVTTDIKESGESLSLQKTVKSFRVRPGESVLAYTMELDGFKAWSPDQPNLYDVGIVLEDRGSGFRDYSDLAVGFKDLRVDDEGYFVLNGERFFVKCCHTGSYVIGSIDVGADIERMLHQLDYFKASGFNMVRFISAPALPEMLDYCDRIGLMVYEEPYMSWKQTDFARTTELFHESVAQIARRDRSHVSFAVLCMLNETYGTEATHTNQRFEAAVSAPGVVRQIDNDVLMLLSSGRWDYNLEIGSACNPGSTEWNAYMGNEGGVEATNTTFQSQFSGMGDLHFYPQMPYNAAVGDLFRAMGDVRASFLSEAGAGSQPNIISDYYTLVQEKNHGLGFSYNNDINRQLQVLAQLYEDYKLNQVYAAQEDFIIESQIASAKQRSLLTDYIRSNPKISGYSLTQGPDIGYRGEGVLEGMMTHKATMYDTLSDCWDDLRWCINVRDYNLYSTEELQLTVDLSDINVLEEGRAYAAYLSITGGGKTMWSKTVTITENGSFVIPVVSENIPLSDFASGEYKISAVIDGVNAGSSTKSFWVTNKKDLPAVSGTIYYYGLSDAAIDLLAAQGADMVEYAGQEVPEKSTILIGRQPGGAVLDAAYAAAEKQGCHVAGVVSEAFGGSLYSYSTLPFESGVAIAATENWLYHADSVVHETAITQGLQTGGLLDPLYYEDIYDSKYYTLKTVPDEIHCVQLLLGDDAVVNNYTLLHGVKCGTYNCGSGYITINTFDLNGSIGAPTADRLLLNMANYIGSK